MKLSSLLSPAPKPAPPPPAPTPEQRERAEQWLARPMAELVRAWITAINGYPERWQGRLRLRATDEQVDDLARRLGCRPPRALREFYASCNGVSSMSGEFPHLLLPAQALVRGHEHRPPLSQQCRRRLAASPDPEGETATALRVEPAPLLPTAALARDELSADDIDRLLALEIPRFGCGVTMNVDADEGFARGVVFELDGTRAICHDSLAHWLATQTALLGRAAPAAISAPAA
ncbi:MAG: hypothetical protein QM766_07630 [Burkholderiaceae bacterium]